MAIQIGSAEGGWTDLDPTQYELLYDFTSPGKKTVTVRHKDIPALTATFDAWVVGLTALTATGPGGYTADLGFDQTSSTYSGEDLTVIKNIHELYIAATSGVTSIADGTVSLTINGTEGSAKTIGLAELPASNTITIVTTLTKGSSTESRTYTLTVERARLLSGDEIFVSGPDADPAGDEDGNGTVEHPYNTVQSALDLIRNSGLQSVDNSYVTIIITGTVTAGSGSNGMVDISGSGYPKKIILRGKSGTEPGVLDASGKNMRVLYIANGNKLELGDDLTLKGGSAYFGGGVRVDGGSFTMSGGYIQGNTSPSDGGGGGVSVDGGGTFTMSGGYIQGNTAFYHSIVGGGPGGGVYVGSGSFTMSGGYIQGNASYNSGYGGGVYVSNSTGNTFTKTGGTIYGDNNTSHDGSNGSTENTASTGNGHAVYLDGGNQRNATSPANHDLYAKFQGGGWTYTNGTIPASNWTDPP
jgi:hypothetical protein